MRLVKIKFKKLLKGDNALWIIITLLSLISLIAIYSSTIGLSERGDSSFASHALNQLLWLVIGFFCIWFISTFISASWVISKANIWMILAFILSLLVFVPHIGVSLNEASRWIKIPFVGILICPFEFLWVAVILYMTRQLSLMQDEIKNHAIIPKFWGRSNKSKESVSEILIKRTCPILLFPLLSIALIVSQSLSTALILSVMVVIMLFIGNVKFGDIMSFCVYSVCLLVVAIMFFALIGFGRVTSWVNRISGTFNPNKTEQVDVKQVQQTDYEYFLDVIKNNEEKNPNYQRILARVAMASGGITGKGPGNSTLRAKLPNSYDDFVYAFIVEEYGFLGGMLVLFLYVAFFIRGLIIANRSRYYSLRLAALGLVIHIILTAFIHMIVATGEFLTTGQTLPLISKGGSSILANSIAIGIILSISAHDMRPSAKTEPSAQSVDNTVQRSADDYEDNN